MEGLKKLAEYVEYGKRQEAKSLAQKLLGENISPDTIVKEGIMAGLNALGERFEKFEAFVPELMVAGRAAKEVLEVLKPKMTQGPLHKIKGTVVIGTVEGDVHDVGKNIVAMVIEGGGFKVIDLGVDVPPSKFIKEVKYHEANILALSALYTPTRLAMKGTLELLRTEGIRDSIKVMVGGAPIDQNFCDLIGADGYAPDAPAALKLAERLAN
ncbi:MAG: methyltransferase [Deltaproteobacteria bacterium RBG_13_49_15]|nr:MAG: methyltransferase [Deltaproteobacteria bacterium RBG_13_49_15]